MKAWLFALLVIAGGGYSHQQAYPSPNGFVPQPLSARHATPPAYAKTKAATLRMEMRRGVCSATAVGHHTVLTAEHCLEGDIEGVRFNGRTARVTRIERDGNDHALLTTDLYFRHVAKFGPRPAQGDVVFSHANPDGYADLLMVGRVAGWVPLYMGMFNVMLLDRNDWYGCSGAAVFDSRGRIVGVVNAIFPWPQKGWRLTAIFPLAFTDAQWGSA